MSAPGHGAIHVAYVDVPDYHRGYALLIVVYIFNDVSTKATKKTPYELWIWGSLVYVRKKNPDKVDLQSYLCYFGGCPRKTKLYYFYDKQELKVFVSKDAFSLENDMVVVDGKTFELR